MEWILLPLFVALPALVGEGLSRGPLKRWPTVAYAFGGVVVIVSLSALALLTYVCFEGTCDELVALRPWAWATVAGAFVLTVATCLWPHERAWRYALWASPLVVGVAIAVWLATTPTT